jgi:hypothetical protein
LCLAGIVASHGYGTTEFDVLREQLGSDERSAYIRAMLRRASDGWKLVYASALVGAEPPGWSQDSWEYEQLGSRQALFSPGSEAATNLGRLASRSAPQSCGGRAYPLALVCCE